MNLFPKIRLVVLVAAGLASTACTASSLGAEAGAEAQAGVQAQTGQGEAVYRENCASCHPPELFAGVASSRILETLEAGTMNPFVQVMGLDRAELEAVSNYLGSSDPLAGPGSEAFCRDRRVNVDLDSPFVWNGWSAGPGNTRFQTGPAAGLTAQEVPGLRLRWAFGFEDDLASFSQPAVIGDQVFVGSSGGILYALDAPTGCIQWTYHARGPIRTAVLVAPVRDGHAVLFGDQLGWFYAVRAGTGELLWSQEVETHVAARITGSPAVHEGVVFVPVGGWEEMLASLPDYPCCSFRGSVVALSVESGDEVWKSYLAPEAVETGARSDQRPLLGPSGVPTWSAPTVDAARGRIYVTTGNNYTDPATAQSDAVLALDMATGRVVWSRQVTPDDVFSGCGDCAAQRGPDYDFGSSAILVPLQGGGDILLAGQKSGVVYGLDPDREGSIVWQTRIAEGSTHGGVQWGMASDGRLLYAPIADGALLTEIGEDGIGRRFMDPDDGGGLAALDIRDGTEVWRAAPARVCAGIPNCSPSQLAAATVIPGVVFSGALDGHIRAYSTEGGRLIWDYDTLREFSTVNGVRARGGALNGNGPVVANGLVLVNSGYNHFGTITGNVLLAFAP